MTGFYNTKRVFLFLLAAVPLFTASCNKKWKEPAKVTFGFKLSANTSSGLIKFSSGYIMLSEIDFTGERRQGDNHIEFSKDYQPNAQVNLNPYTLSSGFTFDIPQGTYTSIDLKSRIDAQPNNMPSMVMFGTYVDSLNNVIAVRLELRSGEVFDMPGQNTSGGNEITLVEDKASTVSVNLNPQYWFDAVPESMLEDAEAVSENGITTMVISESENQDIYQLIAGRIKDGNSVIFN